MHKLPHVSILAFLAAFAMGVSECESPELRLLPVDLEPLVGTTVGTLDQLTTMSTAESDALHLQPGAGGYQSILTFVVPEVMLSSVRPVVPETRLVKAVPLQYWRLPLV